MTNELEIQQEDKLLSIGKQMETFPEIKVSGALIVDNYDEQIEKLNILKNLLTNLTFTEIKSDEEYWNINEILKSLGLFQTQIKDGLQVLDDDKVSKIRELTLEVSAIIGEKRGKSVNGFTYLLEFYKEKAITRIIDCGFDNIKQQKDFEKEKEEFKKYCLEQFKGTKGLKFDKLQDQAMHYADVFNNEMELNQLKLEKNIIELKKFCDEIEFIPDMDNLKVISKELVFNRMEIEDAEMQLREKKEQQEKALGILNAKKLEAEKLSKSKEMVEEIKEPVILNEKPIIEKEYTFTITIQTTLTKKELLKEFLLKNEINYK